MPQGINPTKIFLELNLTAQNTNRYLNKLIKKGLITKRKQGIITNYFITQAGVNALSSQAVQSTVSIYPTQRPHALQVNAFLFRTSWDRLQATLESLSLPYHKELKGNLMRFNWRGRELRATSQYLYTISELPPLPINVPIEQVKARAMQEAGAYIELFLTLTGLRCKRDRLGMLALEVRYWENGYPGNEIAEESLRDKSRIVYAYDRATNQVRAWADSSLGDLKELETNSARVDTQLKAFIQAVEDGELKPYWDEIQTRRDITGLTGLANTILANQESQLKWFEHHDKLTVELTKLVKDLREEKRQRRL
jgi:hypothetical protein